MSAGVMPDALRKHLTRRANQRQDPIIAARGKIDIPQEEP
jgi:hypothetical protein